MSLIGKLRYIFDRKQKLNIFKILVLIVVGTGLELFGVTALYPFINISMNPDSVNSDKFLNSIFLLLGFKSINGFLAFVAILLVVIYVIKNLFLIYMNRSIFKFNYSSQHRMAAYLTRQYLKEPYIFFTKHNSADLIRNIKDDTMELFDSMVSAMQLIAELMVTAALFIYLLYKDKTITLLVGAIILIFIGVVIKKVKSNVEVYGKNTRDARANINKWLLQTFGGIKEIKASNKSSFFSKKVDSEYEKYASSQIGYQLMQYIPKPLMEMVCIGAVLSAIAIKLLLGVAPGYFISTIAVFAVAAFRLLPSFNKITGCINRISFGIPSISAVYEELKMLRDIEKTNEKQYEQMRFKESIVISDLSFGYEGVDNKVFNNVNIVIPKNKSVAFIGASGAGKTTLVDIILGLLKPTKGSIFVDGEDIFDNIECWQESVGYVPQSIYLLDDTIANNVCFADNNRNEARITEVLADAQLLEYVNTLEERFDTVVGERGIRLSGGQRQRIGIARALYNDPNILIFDEATSALDNETESAVMDAINALKGRKTLIIVAHRLSTIENCDMVYRVENEGVIRIR